MPVFRELADKSVLAAIAAIEVYNKPHFAYREEAFSLLMTNAWELLLKAKWLNDHGDAIDTLYEFTSDKSGNRIPRTSRSGNPITVGLTYLAAKLLEDKTSGVESPCFENIHALVAIRDMSAHLVNKDLYLGRRILEIGTASLRNYLHFATIWFQLDLSSYNFFLMPISFYHGFETVEPACRTHYPEQVQQLLKYLDCIEATDSSLTEVGQQNFSIRLETKLVKAKDQSAMAFRVTNDPNAPKVLMREEDVLKNYPLDYRKLVDALRNRFSDFIENLVFHRQRHALESESKYVLVRLLDPTNPKSSKKKFYNANILPEFDKYYKKRSKS